MLGSMRTPLTPEQKAAKQREYNLRWEERHPGKREEMNRRTRERLGPEYWREKHQALKRSMVEAYGGKCQCCGEAEIEFLSLDHVGGGGNQHRKAVGSSRVIRDLRDAGWPQEGYRILCMNCNIATKYGRQCPHQT
jgi:hypothetical protein